MVSLPLQSFLSGGKENRAQVKAAKAGQAMPQLVSVTRLSFLNSFEIALSFPLSLTPAFGISIY